MQQDTSNNRKRFIAWLVIGAVALFVLWRASWVMGPLRKIEIAGPSMAPTLVGRHQLVNCSDCNFSFRAVANNEDELVCPNCGQKLSATGHERRQADQVWIDRLPYRLRSPGRWELVAFRDPLDLTQLAVKRIIGRGSEQVTIDEGDIYIDGNIASKALAQLQQVAVLVHDDRFRAKSQKQNSRWQADRKDSEWIDAEGKWTLESKMRKHKPDWLTYAHRTSMAVSGMAQRPAPVSDHYGINQSVSRATNVVRDLYFRGRIQFQRSQGEILISIHDTRDRYTANWNVRRNMVTLTSNGAHLARHSVRPKGGRLELHFAVCDRRLLLKIGEQRFPPTELQPGDGPIQPTTQPVSIGVNGNVGLTIDGLQLWRDLHYLNQFGESRQRFARTNKDQLIVLGDNVPISKDSRQWSVVLSRQNVVGQVMP